MTDDNKKQWYFNTVKKQAELGMVSPIEQRMGPYKTKEDAEHAWDIVVDRNARWEEENRRWKNYGVLAPRIDGRKLTDTVLLSISRPNRSYEHHSMSGFPYLETCNSPINI